MTSRTPKVLYTSTVLACTYGTVLDTQIYVTQLQPQKLLSTIEMKMVFTQQPPHQQQQERNRNEAQISEKWKTLLRQNLHLLRKIA